MTMKEESIYKPSEGAVTFLDVLGWKGIYQKDVDAVRSLTKLISQIENLAKMYSSQVSYSGNPELRGIESKVLSISDTIAIFTKGKPEDTIPIHAKICSEVIPMSLSLKIPVRGAISYGKYYVHNNIMIGPAVDESASWHESTDWIGVVLSPTAQIHILDKTDNLQYPVVKYDNIPYKKNTRHLNTCVGWEYNDSNRMNDIIIEMGPHISEIANKYLNTIEFTKFIKKNYINKVEEDI